MTKKANLSVTPQKELGFFSVLALVIGVQIGSGIFLLPAQLAPYGFFGIIGWAASGAGAILLSLSFAVLARHSPTTGSPHTYVRQAFGDGAAFYTAWSHWFISVLSTITTVTLSVVAFEDLMTSCGFPGLKDYDMWMHLLLLFIILFFNIRGIKNANFWQKFLTFLKIIPIIIIPIICIPFIRTVNLIPSSGGSIFSALSTSTLLTFWGFIGLELGTTMSNKVRNAASIIPKALVCGTAIVALVCAFNSFVIMGVVPPEILANSPNCYGTLLNLTFGPSWGNMLSLIVLVMCVGSLNSWVLACGEISTVAAEEKLFPALFARLNAKGSPVWSVGITLGLMMLGVVLMHNQDACKKLNIMMTVSVFLYVVIYFVSVLALARLIWVKKIVGEAKQWPVILLSSAFCGWIFSTTEWEMILYSALIPLSGIVIPFSTWVLNWWRRGKE